MYQSGGYHMNRRTFFERGLGAGVAASSTSVTQTAGQERKGRAMLPAPRQIGQEVFHNTGYDAIWYLVNVGFVIRLGGNCIFLDPIFQSGNPEYDQLRKSYQKTGLFPPEVRFYDPRSLYLETEHYPLSGSEIERADYVLLTHDHTDHCEPKSVKALARHNPKIISPKSCHKMLVEEGVSPNLLEEATHGTSFQADEFTIKVQYAHHKGSAGACGFILETRYGNIYHPGDGNFDHLYKSENCDLEVDYLLLPINDTNLGVGFAALLTRILQPRVVIPCHYGFWSPPVRSQGGHPAEFVTALAARNYHLPATDIVILNPGGKYVLV